MKLNILDDMWEAHKFVRQQEKKDKKMATNDKTNSPLFTVETAKKDGSYYSYNEAKTYEEIEKIARSTAWRDGNDVYIMSPVAVVRAPMDINTTTVEKL